MNDLLVLAASFAAAVLVTEVLVREKLQSALGRVVAVHCLAFAVAAWATHTLPGTSAFVFWTGMFALWFGLRSHVESSILLRMLTSLRERPASREEILLRYNQLYGRAARVDELVRAGLVTRTPTGIAPTTKGRVVARTAVLLG
jgi:hypothetical protein